jgi:o-succinylbenzoate synthase
MVGETYFRIFQDVKFSWTERQLIFKTPARTSRDVLHTRNVWYLLAYSQKDDYTAIGECAPIKGLSIDNPDQIEKVLEGICLGRFNRDELNQMLLDFPSVNFALEMVIADLENRKDRLLFGQYPLTIPINGLIWMNEKETMLAEAFEKIATGYACIKLKIGGLNFNDELDILRQIRERYSADQLIIRLDANGAFAPDEAAAKLDKLNHYGIHSIEQPVKPGQWDLMRELVRAQIIPIALDEELIGVKDLLSKEALIEKIQPQYLILKPGILGGFSACEDWIDLTTQCGGNWWATSALESNLGLNAIAQWVGQFEPLLPQGLGTGSLFTNNIESPIVINQGYLKIKDSFGWNLSPILENKQSIY